MCVFKKGRDIKVELSERQLYFDVPSLQSERDSGERGVVLKEVGVFFNLIEGLLD